MKAIITLFFIFFIGMSGQAQSAIKNTEKKVATTENLKEITLEKENNVARLYMFKNYRVIKALSFTTKRSKSKLV